MAATGTDRSPDAKPGSTAFSTSRVAIAFSSSGRARMVDARMRARLNISLRRSSSICAPAPTPITTIRPRSASASRLAGQFGAPTSSRITSNGPASPNSSGAIALTPSAAISSRQCSSRTVAVTRAPAIVASCTAAVPTPPAAPWTSSRSPTDSPACVNSASWAVKKTSGTPPAAIQSSSSGTGIATRSLTTASSA